MKSILRLDRRSFAAFLLAGIIVTMQGIAQPATEPARNGIIVKADNENEAVQAALGEFIDLLNASLMGKTEARARLERHFGRWLSKRNQLSSDHDETNEAKLHLLLSPDGKAGSILQPGTDAARRVGVPEGTIGSYVAIVPLAETRYRFAAMFFRVEAINQVSDGSYDVAFIPGMFFVGDPLGAQ